MRILITNDDGIQSIGLKILAEKAKKYGDVIVVAPKVEQSATSQAIRIRQGLSFEKIEDLVPGVDTYTVDSTPADCVRFACYFLKDSFDVVFSGINNGFNLGEDILYSGTVGAATEGVLAGRKAIAFSCKHNHFETAEVAFDQVMEYILKHDLLNLSPLWNVNIPVECQGIKYTRQGHTYFDTILELEGDRVYQRGKAQFEKDRGLMYSDVAAVLDRFVSITPLTVDRTDKSVFDLIIKK